MGTYAKVKNQALQNVMKQPVFAIVSHWLFQSLFYMDATERWLKIGLDVVLSILIGSLLSMAYSSAWVWPAALMFAHTLNFLLNGQLWGVLKHYGFIKTHKVDFQRYVLGFKQRALAESSINQVLVYGSLARGQWKEQSDFDARIVRKPGFRNGISAAVFLLRERSRALFYIFPLDVYVLDGLSSVYRQKLAEDGKDLLKDEWRLI